MRDITLYALLYNGHLLRYDAGDAESPAIYLSTVGECVWVTDSKQVAKNLSSNSMYANIVNPFVRHTEVVQLIATTSSIFEVPMGI